MEKCTHAGHRNRLKERFIASPKTLEDHELIELLLFYVIPRANTNETAHKLINRFGSIKGIFDAGIPALSSVDGVGEKSAVFIRVVSEILTRYERCSADFSTPLSSVSELGAYLRSLFVATDNEISYLLLFDSSKRLILCKKVGEGHATENSISTRDIAFLALSNNANGAILVHNHPGGKPIPSGEDISTTNHLKWMLDSMGVQLIDHFIVAGNECRPILNANNAKFNNI